jgi:uncharacterized protein with FMN-binding domain
MSEKQIPSKRIAYAIRKYLISIFVMASFAGYVLHERAGGESAGGAALPAQPAAETSQRNLVVTIYAPSPTAAATPTDAPSPSPVPTRAAQTPTSAPSATAPLPTDTPVPTEPPPTQVPAAVASNGAYKDGSYTGNPADAYWGNVQVKVVIQDGKIADVQFVDYPHDRRRSAQINNQAMPWLQQEAIQAQSAQVDIISGATLTSQAFIESLQSALSTARG